MQQPRCYQRKNLAALIGAVATLSCLLYGASIARADIDRFPYTYSWFTASKNEAEFGWRHIQPRRGQHWQDQFEIEYGVTDRYTVEAYLIENRSGGFRDFTLTSGDADGDAGDSGSGVFDPIKNGAAYRSGGFLLEQRYRFGDYHYRRLLPSAYLEYEHFRGEKAEMEGKLILQYDPNGHETFVLNLVSGQPLKAAGKAPTVTPLRVPILWG